ncbi:MAG: thioredoxin domain-containing protein [Candidatus Paceibacterota bacterium]
MEDSKKNKINIGLAIIVAGVIIAGAILLRGSKPVDTNTDDAFKLSEEEQFLGDKNAPITYIEYGDYQCPVCGYFFTTVVSQLKKDYIDTGKVKFVFRGFQFLGPESFDAANAVLCAKEQGKFWEFNDAILNAEIKDGKEHNGNLNKDLFLKIATDVGIADKDSFIACSDNGKYAEKIKEDSQKINESGINSTPTSVINGQVIVGVDYARIKNVIETILKK